MASQQSVVKDTNVILRLGYNGALTGTTDNPITETVSCSNDEGGIDMVVPGWRITKVKYDTDEDKKKAAAMVPLVLKVSRRAPNVVIRKEDNVKNDQIDALKEVLSKSKAFLDMNDPQQWDRDEDKAIGPNASRPWFFEDMRKTREKKMGSSMDNLKISEVLVDMATETGKMRDALFIIGERPLTTDSDEDLKFALYNCLVGEDKQEAKRRKFLEYFVHKGLSPKEIDAEKWFEKGKVFGIITNNNGVFISGTDRLGMSVEEAVQTIMHRDEIRSFLISSISAKSKMEEDKAAASELIKKANKGASSKDVDESIAIDYIKNLSKEKGLATNPGPMFVKCKNLDEVIKKYNSKLKEANLPDPVFLSRELVLEQVSSAV